MTPKHFSRVLKSFEFFSSVYSHAKVGGLIPAQAEASLPPTGENEFEAGENFLYSSPLHGRQQEESRKMEHLQEIELLLLLLLVAILLISLLCSCLRGNEFYVSF